MNENINKKEKLRGLARVISKQVEPLKNNEKFIEDFKDKNAKILLNPKDGKYAALISFNNGYVTVESIKNTPKENLDKSTLKWDGFIQTSYDLFLVISTGKISKFSMIKKVLTRKIKLKAPKNVALLDKMFSYLDNE